MLAVSNIESGIVNHRSSVVRIFVLLKNRVLALACMGDEAPPTPGGRNGGSDVL